MSRVAEQKQKLKSMSLDELKVELLSLRKTQFLLRLKRKNEGALEQPHQITEARKQIARIKTLMTTKAGEADVN
ncbi:MAG: 50S ribosomal protein L29 [Legionellaceae bacterium]|nr:50S ribosomal protein L29 [Legionellaceae bacterium]